MESRLQNPALLVPGAMQALQQLAKIAEQTGLPEKTIGLVHLRASQINGCGVCVDMHAHLMRKSGETEQRTMAVAAWRDTPYFTAAERAALALTESETRLNDRADPVPDEVWNEAARRYDERQLAGLVLAIAIINVWNRLNVTTRQIAGEWFKSDEGKKWQESHAVAQ